jgi:hypothetical protein
MRRTLEDILLEEGLLDETRLKQVRHSARRGGTCLAHAAVETGQVDDERLAEAVARHTRCDRVRLATEAIDEDAVREVAYDLAEGHRLLPLSIDGSGARRVIRVAMADPLDFDAVEEIEISTGCYVDPVVVRVGEVAEAVRRHYRGVITKMIPRRADSASGTVREPTTKPHINLPDEAPAEARLRVLVDLLCERGVLDREAYEDAVRRIVKGDL